MLLMKRFVFTLGLMAGKYLVCSENQRMGQTLQCGKEFRIMMAGIFSKYSWVLILALVLINWGTLLQFFLIPLLSPLYSTQQLESCFKNITVTTLTHSEASSAFPSLDDQSPYHSLMIPVGSGFCLSQPHPLRLFWLCAPWPRCCLAVS